MYDDFTFFSTRKVVKKNLLGAENRLQALSTKQNEITKQEYDQLGVNCKGIVKLGTIEQIKKLSSMLRKTRISLQQTTNLQATPNCLESLEDALAKVLQKRSVRDSSNGRQETPESTLQLNRGIH